jgi:hypothetical protein
VTVQLQYVLARKGMRGREIEAQTFVDDFIPGIFEAVQFRNAWLRQPTQQTPGEFGRLPTRDAYDADTTAAGRGGNGGNRVGIGMYL